MSTSRPILCFSTFSSSFLEHQASPSQIGEPGKGLGSWFKGASGSTSWSGLVLVSSFWFSLLSEPPRALAAASVARGLTARTVSVAVLVGISSLARTFQRLSGWPGNGTGRLPAGSASPAEMLSVASFVSPLLSEPLCALRAASVARGFTAKVVYSAVLGEASFAVLTGQVLPGEVGKCIRVSSSAVVGVGACA